jgi:hypothetical protein
LRTKNERLKNKQSHSTQVSRKGNEPVDVIDPTEGLDKVMVDLNMKERELGNLNIPLRRKVPKLLSWKNTPK